MLDCNKRSLSGQVQCFGEYGQGWKVRLLRAAIAGCGGNKGSRVKGMVKKSK